jgi:hypothetical protein
VGTLILGGIVRDDEPLDLEIREEELADVTDEELAEWCISRETLQACFAEGVDLMNRKTETERVCPFAKHMGEGPDDWFVFLVGYSRLTDPLVHYKLKDSA